MLSDDTEDRNVEPNEVEVESRLIEDAIAEGLARLGITRAEAEVEILEEGTKGFLGLGAKNAKVRVSKAGSRPRRSAHAPRKQASERERKPSGERERKPSGERERKPETSHKTPEEQEKEKEAIVEATRKLVSVLDEKATVEVTGVEDGKWKVNVNTDPESLALVLGRRGRTLDAIQTLSAAIASRQAGDKVRMLLDTGGFREKRRETLQQMADQYAEEAIETGQVIHLDPMSSYDRKIIHSALAANKNVETMSEDTGDKRHIVIRPKSGDSSRRGDRDRGGRSSGSRNRRGGRRGGRGRGQNRSSETRERESSEE